MSLAQKLRRPHSKPTSLETLTRAYRQMFCTPLLLDTLRRQQTPERDDKGFQDNYLFERTSFLGCSASDFVSIATVWRSSRRSRRPPEKTEVVSGSASSRLRSAVEVVEATFETLLFSFFMTTGLARLSSESSTSRLLRFFFDEPAFLNMSIFLATQLGAPSQSLNLITLQRWYSKWRAFAVIKCTSHINGFAECLLFVCILANGGATARSGFFQ